MLAGLRLPATLEVMWLGNLNFKRASDCPPELLEVIQAVVAAEEEAAWAQCRVCVGQHGAHLLRRHRRQCEHQQRSIRLQPLPSVKHAGAGTVTRKHVVAAGVNAGSTCTCTSKGFVTFL